MELTIKVICEDLPGTEFSGIAGGEPFMYRPVHLGIQRGDEVIEAVPASQKRVIFNPGFRVAPLPGGKTNFLGPYAKGTQSERFFYLSWVEKSAHGGLRMVGRAKIHLSHLPWAEVEKAIQSGRPLSVTLSLTDKRGRPRCGSIRGDGVRWHE